MALPIRLEATQTPNLQQLRIGATTVFYSYLDPIAFMEGTKLTVRDTKGISRTTQKHANVMDQGDTGYRQPVEEFMINLEGAMKRACASIK